MADTCIAEYDKKLGSLTQAQAVGNHNYQIKTEI